MVKTSRAIVALLSAIVVALGLSSCTQNDSRPEPESYTTTVRPSPTSEPSKAYKPIPYESISDSCEYPNFEEKGICMPVPKDIVYTVTSDEPSTVTVTYAIQDSPSSLWDLSQHVRGAHDNENDLLVDVSPEKPWTAKGRLSYPERFAGIEAVGGKLVYLRPNYTCSIAINGVVVITDNDPDNNGEVTCMLSDEFLEFMSTEYRSY